MRSGFSLLEMAVVFAVLGITMAVTVPALRFPASRTPAEVAFDDVAGLVRSTRRAALRSGVGSSLVIDPATGRYWASGGDLGEGESGRLETLDAVELGTAGTRARFEFAPDGTTLSDPIVVSGVGGGITLEVDRWTGEIRAAR